MLQSFSLNLLPCNSASAGEINTLQGNLNWVASRQAGLRNDIWQGREGEFLPLCSARGEWAGCWAGLLLRGCRSEAAAAGAPSLAGMCRPPPAPCTHIAAPLCSALLHAASLPSPSLLPPSLADLSY